MFSRYTTQASLAPAITDSRRGGSPTRIITKFGANKVKKRGTLHRDEGYADKVAFKTTPLHFRFKLGVSS